MPINSRTQWSAGPACPKTGRNRHEVHPQWRPERQWTRIMVHVAIQEADDQGQVVTWGEHVTDQEYDRPTTTTN